MGLGIVWLNVPLGPLTVTTAPSSATSTPAGTGTGTLPMRDMGTPLSVFRLPDVGEDFPTYALRRGLPVGQEARGRGQDRHAEAAEHLGKVGGLGVHAQARLGHALDASERTLAVRAELEVDRERLADARVLDAPARDVALGLEDLHDVLLELRVRHGHRLVVSRVRVAQPREHVCDRVSHCHGGFPPFLAVVSARPLRGRYGPAASWLPAALSHTGKLAAVCHLTKADTAEAELAVHRARTSAPLAPGIASHRELRGGLGLVDQRGLRHGQSSLKGKPRRRRSERPSSSVVAVVTMVMSIPRTRSILSWSISWNIDCSVRPNV